MGIGFGVQRGLKQAAHVIACSNEVSGQVTRLCVSSASSRQSTVNAGASSTPLVVTQQSFLM